MRSEPGLSVPVRKAFLYRLALASALDSCAHLSHAQSKRYFALRKARRLASGRSCFHSAPSSCSLPPMADYRMNVVFSAECTALFDWHSVAIFYSFEVSNFSRTANITRLLACSEKARAVDPRLARSARAARSGCSLRAAPPPSRTATTTRCPPGRI